MHVCPLVTPGLPPIPHVGGPILPPGAPTVLVGGLPAARLGDMAMCVGPPDVIVMGAATVLIGGVPASRLTDMTVHGGVLTAPGMPTVLIGDPAFALPPNITLQGSPDFQSKTIRDLYLLSTTPSGKALIDRLGAAGEPVTIKEHTGTNGFCSPTSGIAALVGIPTGSVIQYQSELPVQRLRQRGQPHRPAAASNPGARDGPCARQLGRQPEARNRS